MAKAPLTPRRKLALTMALPCFVFLLVIQSYFFLDDEVDLNASPKRQRGHRDRRAGRKGLTEILCVDEDSLIRTRAPHQNPFLGLGLTGWSTSSCPRLIHPNVEACAVHR